jgi:hypothetical protein
VQLNLGRGTLSLLERVKAAASPDAAVRALRIELDRVRAIRWSIYQNDAEIGRLFALRQANVTKLLTGGGVAWEISGSYAIVASGKLGKTKTASQEIEITPFLRAVLLEEFERTRGDLVDLAANEPNTGSIVTFVGPGHIFPPWEPVGELAESEPFLDAETAATLQAQREEGENEIRRSDPKYPGRLVWVARGSALFASFASMTRVEPTVLERHRKSPPFGILGTVERMVGEVTLLTPLTIWRPAGEH